MLSRVSETLAELRYLTNLIAFPATRTFDRGAINDNRTNAESKRQINMNHRFQPIRIMGMRPGIKTFLPTRTLSCVLFVVLASAAFTAQAQTVPPTNRLTFESLPNLPNAIGVAGPIVGLSLNQDAMLVAGGANFALPDDPQLWDVEKQYVDQIWLLEKTEDRANPFRWLASDDAFRLSEPVAYPSVVNTKHGILVMGGQNAAGLTSRAFLLQATKDDQTATWKVNEFDSAVPDLPLPCTGGGAALIGDYVYLVAGQTQIADGTSSASRNAWRIHLSRINPDSEASLKDRTDFWEPIPSWPSDGPPKMFPLVATQHDGFNNRLYVLSGRHVPAGQDAADANNLEFTTDGWSFNPAVYQQEKFNPASGEYLGESPWQRIADSPVPMTAGTAVPYGPAHILVVAYASGDVLKQQLDSGVEMKDFDHPGFPKTAYAYHTITNTWIKFGSLPANQVTTPAIRWGDDIMLVSGEVRPRVRTSQVWRIGVRENKKPFGSFNMAIVVVYLLAMVGIGLFFTFRNKSTDDYFRGGKNIPWWAAGCSIFATMLSSITYMAVPAKSFAQDWVYSLGNFMILAVAPIAIYVALPFFRHLDVTSAYEYLELRFNRVARLIGSGSFSLFHIFRMGVVLALAALALSSVTPLTPEQCVVVMGVLSIIYCTLGGIEAVIWTDTIQTFILMGGALFCLFFALSGSDPGSMDAAVEAGKFHVVDFNFSSTSFMTMAIWVVIIGGAGQNLASYTADQAVVQRYMTTPDEKMAARSIWLNGFMAIPAAAIFFGMGTAFWMFYRSNPEKLDPTIAADRIMPHFISQELPMGLAGLVVAGIFAAAQSTVSTSMNSGATTVVTDFFKPLDVFKSDKSYLWLARLITLMMGIVGTAAGLLFVDPDIKSLFDQFIGILGMFLGVLAGLFALGATTRRASGTGSLIGAAVAILFMTVIVFAAKDQFVFGFDLREVFHLFGSKLYRISSYLYAFIGITVCYVVGYLASWVFPRKTEKPLKGLTLWD